jgi:hypothetical protein
MEEDDEVPDRDEDIRPRFHRAKTQRRSINDNDMVGAHTLYMMHSFITLVGGGR